MKHFVLLVLNVLIQMVLNSKSKSKSRSQSQIENQMENQMEQYLSLKDKIMVEDIKGYPAYETNLVTNNTKNNTRPNVNESEPIENIRMENRMEQLYQYYKKNKMKDSFYVYKYIPLDEKTHEPDEDIEKYIDKSNEDDQQNLQNYKVYSDEFDRYVEDQQRKETERQKINNYQFIELENESKTRMTQQQKSKQKILRYQTARFRSAWASSVFSFRFLWYQISFPATNAIRFWSFWCSAGFHFFSSQVTWQGDFDRLYRVSHIYIRWALAPRFYQLQVSEDCKTWTEKKEWTDLTGSRRRSWFRSIFPWFMGGASFAMRIDFDKPFWCKGIRIIMKKPQMFFFGIYKVEVWVNDWIVNLVSANSLKGDKIEILNVMSGVYRDDQRVVASDIVKDLASMDRRDVMVISYNQEIFALNDYYLCLEANNRYNNGRRINDKTRVTVNLCNQQENQKWVIDSSQKIRSKYDQEWCLNVGEELQLADLWDLKTKESSDSPDEQNCLRNTYDGSDQSYWMSNLNEENVFIEYLFERVQVIKIMIEWKYKAKEFTVKIYKEGQWESIFTTKSNSVDQTDINLGSQDIDGISIVMNTFHPDSKLFANSRDNSIYGIKEVKIETQLKKVYMKECKKLDNGEFIIEDVFFLYNRQYKYIYHHVINYAEMLANQLLKLLNQVVQLPKVVSKQLKFGKYIKDGMKELNEYLENQDIKISEMHDFIVDLKKGNSGDGEGAIGTHAQSPAKNCFQIKMQFKYKKSGYYWIQPICSKQSLRVFCDYQVQRQGTSYAYYGGIEPNQRLKESFKNILDLRMVCAKIGLEMVDIKTEMQYNNIKGYLWNVGVTLNTQNVIPLFYDYTCKNGWFWCRLKYRSLNSEKSAVQSGMIWRNFNKAFLFTSGLTDYVGWGLNRQGKLLRFTLGNSKYPIKGVICSTNYDPSNQDPLIDFTCDDVCVGNSKCQFDNAGTLIPGFCPKACNNNPDNMVYGSKQYKLSSNICRSAIHSGVIEESGGPFYLNIDFLMYKKDVLEKTDGSDNSGVTSSDFFISKQGEHAMSFQKYKVECPIHEVRKAKGLPPDEDSASFIQLYQSTELSPNNSSFLQLRMKSRSRSRSRLNEQIQNHQDDVPDEKETKQSQQDKKDDKGEDEDDKKESEEEEKATQEVFEEVRDILNLGNNRLKKIVRLVSDSIKLQEKLNEQMSPLVSGEYNTNRQLKQLEGIMIHMKNSYLNIIKDQNVLKAFVKSKQMMQDQLYRKKMQLVRYDPWKIDYDDRIEMVFDIFDYQQNDLGPSSWTYNQIKKDNLLHNFGISQKSYISHKGLTFASVFILKYKTFYDAKFSLSVSLRDQGVFGILFRATDYFNYYALVFDFKKKMKMFIRVINGKETEIDRKEDGGYMIGQWIRVALKFQMGLFQVYIQKETDRLLSRAEEDQFPLVFETFDTSLSAGSVGLAVNGLSELYVDKMEVRPMDCKQLDYQITTRIVNTICNNWNEGFDGYFNDNWSIIEDIVNSKKQAQWGYQNNKVYQKVLEQRNIYQLQNDIMAPTWIKLKLDKFCNIGVFHVEFVAKDSGIVTLGFHYKNQMNHYAVQIFPSELNKCNMVRTVQGSEKLVQNSKDSGVKCGFEKNKKTVFKIEMTMMENIVYMFDESTTDFERVLSCPYENEYPNTAIAVGNYATRVIYTKIQFYEASYYEAIQAAKAMGGSGGGEGGEGGGGGSATGQKMSDLMGGGGSGEGGSSQSNGSNQQNKKNKQSDDDDDESNNESGGGINFSVVRTKPKKLKCKEIVSKFDRMKFCKDKFMTDTLAINDCMNNFCPRCCGFENQLDPLNKNKVATCIKKCDVAKQPASTKLDNKNFEFYIQCVQPSNSLKNTLIYCDKIFIGDHLKEEKKQCMLDMCQLCCVNVNNVFSISLSLNNILDCRIRCIEKFRSL